MMQFNMYHHYTVDEHLIRTVGVLSDIERGVAPSRIRWPPRSSPPSRAGARSTCRVPARHRQGAAGGPFHRGRAHCPRAVPAPGHEPGETDTVAWLIEQHLTMSSFAFSRDIGDPKTIRDFANIVQSPERLKLLLVLTIADIRAVGRPPGTAGRAAAARALLRGRAGAGGRAHAACLARPGRGRQAAFRRRSAGRGGGSAYIERHYPDYWLKTETAAAVAHAALIRSAERAGRKLASDFKTDAFTGHHRLDAVCAQPPAAAGLSLAPAPPRCQHLGRAHLDDARRLRARHLPARPRVRSRRGRAAPRRVASPRPSSGC
jgi:[protein-PII] uridylyltransferase